DDLVDLAGVQSILLDVDPLTQRVGALSKQALAGGPQLLDHVHHVDGVHRLGEILGGVGGEIRVAVGDDLDELASAGREAALVRVARWRTRASWARTRRTAYG